MVSGEMLENYQSTLRKINRLDAIFQAMQQIPRFMNLPGLQGGEESAWRQWVALAREQLNNAMNNGGGTALDMNYNNILNMTDEQIPNQVKGLVSSIESQIQTMNLLFEEANPPEPYDGEEPDDENDAGEDTIPGEGDEEGDVPEGGTGMNLPGDNYDIRCLAPRTGHGHEGEPCMVRLGEDGVCQYHG